MLLPHSMQTEREKAMEDDGEGSAVASVSSSGVNSWWACMSDSGDFNNANQPWRMPASSGSIINKNSNRRFNNDPSLLSSSSEQDQICVNSVRVESQEIRVDPNMDMGLSQEPNTDTHIWNQVFLCTIGSNSDLADDEDEDTKLPGALSYKGLRSELLFEGAFDQMKRPANWEFSNYTRGFEPDKLNYLVTKCSLSAPHESQFSQNLADRSTFPSSPSFFLHKDSNLRQIGPRAEIEQNNPSSSSYSDGSSMAGTSVGRPAGYLPCFMQNLKEGKPVDSSNTSILAQTEERNDWHSVKNVADFIHFGGGLNKPLLDFQASKTLKESAELQDYRRYFPETSLLLSRGVVKEKGGNSNEGKKKLEDEPNYTTSKKHKQEGSSIPTSKLQVSKVKLGDRITALQQIVAPFGKTDTASVLLEAITYIKFMQEQVTLLVNHPYVKPSHAKQEDYNLPWRGGSSEKQECETKLDLRSRGLCLVPISCTPEVYRESTGVDCWAPTYRGCLFR